MDGIVRDGLSKCVKVVDSKEEGGQGVYIHVHEGCKWAGAQRRATVEIRLRQGNSILQYTTRDR